MSRVILDISANTHKNDTAYLIRMLNELKEVDTGKHEVIIKHQLFQEAGANIPLRHDVFHSAYCHAKELGYQTTASVFDLDSLKFLLEYDVPMIKIANNRKLDWLIGEIPRKIPVYVSNDSLSLVGAELLVEGSLFEVLFCISKYPATSKEYEKRFGWALRYGISDHTTDFTLWHKYKPEIYEVHYVLEHDPNNLDGGLFARTIKQLEEVL